MSGGGAAPRPRAPLSWARAPMQEELRNGEDVARCPSCSLYIPVVYNPVRLAEGALSGRCAPKGPRRRLLGGRLTCSGVTALAHDRRRTSRRRRQEGRRRRRRRGSRRWP